MALEDEVVLDISSALAELDNLGTALDSIVASFSTDLSDAITTASATPLEVQADTSGAIEEIDNAINTAANTPLDVKADASTVTDEIDSAISAADTTIQVEADTSGLDALATSAENATGAVDGTSAATKGLGIAQGLAGGEVASLGEGFSALGPEAGLAVAGIGAVGAVSYDLFKKALDLNEAEFRFNTILGDQASIVDHVNIGGLNSDIKDLAIEVGGSNEALKNAAANIFQLGSANGTAAPQVSKVTDEIIALASRAVALKPSLGDVGTVADNMTRGLSRGGRFAANFGLSLTASEIQARAFSDTGKTVASQLTIFDKAAAGAEISVEKLGNKLGQDVATGASSAEVSFKSLKANLEETLAEFGKPLIPEFLKVIKEGQPIVKDFAKIFADLGEVLLPIAKVVLPILTKEIDFIAKDFDELPKLIKPVVIVFKDIKLVAEQVGKEFQALATGALHQLERAFNDVAKPAEKLFGWIGKHVEKAVEATGVTKAYRDVMDTLGTSMAQSSASADDADHSLTVLATSTGSIIIPTQQASVSVDDLSKRLAQAQTDADSFTKNAGAGMDGLKEAISDLDKSGKTSINDFIKDLTQKTADALAFEQNLQTLISRGATTLASDLNAAGITSAGAAAQAVKENQKTLDKQEAAAKTAADNQQKIWDTQTSNAQHYADIVNHIPAEVNTQINVKGADDAQNKLSVLIGQAADLSKGITINVDTKLNTPNISGVVNAIAPNVTVVRKSGASGGIVPGALGEPTPILAHGQELILNKSQQAQYGIGQNGITIASGAFQVNINGPVTEDSIPKLDQMLNDKFSQFYRQLQANRN